MQSADRFTEKRKLLCNVTDGISAIRMLISASNTLFAAEEEEFEVGLKLILIAQRKLKNLEQECESTLKDMVYKDCISSKTSLPTKMSGIAQVSKLSNPFLTSKCFDPHHYSASQATIGTRIKSMRELRSLNPNQLAHLLGVKPKAISMWELDFSSPACNQLMPLANALNCDPLWLLTGQESGGAQ